MRPQKLLSGSIFALLNLYHCSNIHKRINQVLRMTDEDKEKNMQTVGNVSFRWLNQKDLGKNIKWINLKIIIPRGKKELSLTNPSEQCRKMRNGSHYRSIKLYHLQLLYGCSLPLFHVGSLPWDSVLPELIPHGLPTGHSSPSSSPTQLHAMVLTLLALFQHGFSQAAAPPALLHHRTLPLHELQFRPGLLLRGLSMGFATFRPHPLLIHVFLHVCMWRSAPRNHAACGLQKDSLFFHGPFLGCRNLLLYTWSISSSPSLLPLWAAGLFPHISSLFHSRYCFTTFFAQSYICSHRSARSVAWGSALTWDWSLLELDLAFICYWATLGLWSQRPSDIPITTKT